MVVRRRGVAAGAFARASGPVCEHIAGSRCFRVARHLSLYAARPWEVDVSGLEHVDPGPGQPSVYYPRVEGDGLVFRQATKPTLLPGRFGIPEPPGNAPPLPPHVAAIILVPGVAFDPHGHRLGSGMGFYDRVLPDHPDAIRIGVSIETFILDEVPSDPWDVPMDAIATERRFFFVVGARAGAHPGDTE